MGKCHPLMENIMPCYYLPIFVIALNFINLFNDERLVYSKKEQWKKKKKANLKANLIDWSLSATSFDPSRMMHLFKK